MFFIHGNRLQVGQPFSVDGVQYPANWLQLTSDEEKAAIGITEVVEQQRPDDRFYWVTENADGSFSTTPKDLEAVRSMRLAEIRAASYSLLSPTDYKLVRHVETGEAVDSATTAARAAIRSAYASNAAAIAAASTVDQLATLTFTWP